VSARNERIVYRYVSGTSVRELAAKHGVSRRSIYQILARAGVIRGTGRPRGPAISPARDARDSEILRRYVAGASARELGLEYGISKERVCQICRAAGVIRRRGRQPLPAAEVTRS